MCETSPQPGPRKELCCRALVKPQAGEMSGETGGTTSTGGESWQHSLQRAADATMLSQSLPKSLLVWVPSIAFFHVHDCTKPMSDCTGVNTHLLKPSHTGLLLPAGKGGLEWLSFSYPHRKVWGYQTATCIEKIDQLKMDKNTWNNLMFCPGGAAISLRCLLKLWKSLLVSAVIFVP